MAHANKAGINSKKTPIEQYDYNGKGERIIRSPEPGKLSNFVLIINCNDLIHLCRH